MLKLPELELRPCDLGSDWQVHAGWIDSRIMDGDIDGAVELAREEPCIDTVLYVLYTGIRYAIESNDKETLRKYHAWVQQLMLTEA